MIQFYNCLCILKIPTSSALLTDLLNVVSAVSAVMLILMFIEVYTRYHKQFLELVIVVPKALILMNRTI